MKVKKRDGRFEDVNLDKITRSIQAACDGLSDVEPFIIATKTVGGLYDGVTTEELDLLSIQTAVAHVAEEPNYGKVAARLQARVIRKEVERLDVATFSQSVALAHEQGLIADQTQNFVNDNKRKLNAAIKHERDNLFEYTGIKTIYDRYLLKHPTLRKVVETPQYFLMRVSCGLSETVTEAIELYNLLSSLEYMTSTPTLFNSGTKRSQMSSCYLLDSPLDDLVDIEKRHADIALLSKWAGGIGLSYTRVRGSGSLIKGTNGKSNGIVPFLHSLSSNVAAVNQCFTEETLVHTPQGKIKISELKVGDAIINSLGQDKIVEIMKSSHTGELVNISVNGKTVLVTPEHPLLVVKNASDFSDDVLRIRLEKGISKPEWIEAQNINKGDAILSMSNL